MIRVILLLSLLATTGCVVYPYGGPQYGAYPYGYGVQAPAYTPAYGGQGYAPPAGDYNPVSGSRTGSD